MTTVYGNCPICGADGISRERRPNGNDTCANGHTYPSRDTVLAKPPKGAIENVLMLLETIDTNYRAFLQECDAKADQFQKEDDMYGWNFQKGLHMGAVQMNFDYHKLKKAIEALPKPTMFVSAVSGMAYENPAAAGDIMEIITNNKHFSFNVSVSEDAE